MERALERILEAARGVAWRRSVAAAASAVVLAISVSSIAALAGAADQSVRPFRANVPESELVELRRRIAATRFPDRETARDGSQGVELARLRDLVHYWGTSYDWRRAEARLNAHPQFTTTIDGLTIHFIHVRSRHGRALPLLITHGWPGSVFEQLQVIEPLTDPTLFGATASEAFDVVIPSMPGYGFSEKPTGIGWDPERIARAWGELMRRLGYSRYVAQGGDWGAPVSHALARQAPPGLLAIHVTLPATVPPDVAAALRAGGPAPPALSPEERAAFGAIAVFFEKYRGYSVTMATRPQTIGYGLTDSPAALLAWIADYNGGEPLRRLDRDDLLDDVTLYWLTHSAASSARLYWENGGRSLLAAAAQKTGEITLPVAITVFPGEIYRTPRSWAQRAYPSLGYFHQVERGGHFAAWEEPELFSRELRAAFRSLRQF
jgi:pimeloyl-ACP methyl ester carboxylesterase